MAAKDFRVTIEVGDLAGRRWKRLLARVDTGSSYLALPQTVQTDLGIAAIETRPFERADGRVLELPVGQVLLRLPKVAGHGLVVMGLLIPEGEALLGLEALEAFGLAVDPVRLRLFRVPGMLKGARLRNRRRLHV
jgi:predicted aspartyl protease